MKASPWLGFTKSVALKWAFKKLSSYIWTNKQSIISFEKRIFERRPRDGSNQ